MIVDTSDMILCDQFSSVDPVESEAIKRLCNEVKIFLKNYSWFRKIKNIWFAGGFSKVSVFFVDLESIDFDDKLWVIVGDLPPAYLVVDHIPDFKEALLSYAFYMREWVDAVRLKKSIRDCIPVNVAPTAEHADLLERRLDFIEKEYVPGLQGGGGS